MRFVPAALLLVPLVGLSPDGAQRPTISDPGRSRQWALDVIDAPAGWSVATGAGITIAIVDSGIDRDHPDLRQKIDGSTDCVGHDDEPGGCLDGAGADDAGHGTHVAGIAAASTDNEQGIAGVAPLARLLAVRVLANQCDPGTSDPSSPSCEAEGTESDVAEGVRWAADHGAEVINLSLGSVTQAVVGPGQAFADALDYAWSRGAIPVLVAGNDLLLPGSLIDVPAVIVSATDRDDRRASYSNGVGTVRWAVAAPGGESDTAESCESDRPNGILSTFYRPAASGGSGTSEYACVAGTSMAAPHVAGALAVLRSAGLGPQEAVDRLLDTATDLGPAGPDTTYGAGRIDLGRALAGVEPTGQPVRAADAGGPTSTGVPMSLDTTSTSLLDADDPVPTSVPARTDAPSTTSSGAARTGTGRTGDERAAGTTTGRRAGDDDGDALPVATVAAAVGAILAVGAGHAMRYRTLRRPRRP